MGQISNLTQSVPAEPTALVTGATGRLGAALTRRMAQSGYRLCLSGRRQKRLQELRDSLNEVPHGAHVMVPIDLEEENAGEELARRALNELGDLTVALHLACPTIRSEDRLYDAHYFQQMMQVTAAAFLQMSDVLLPAMLPVQNGCLAGLLSAAMKPPLPQRRSAFIAAKTALLGALNVVARHCQDTGVRAVGIVPSDREDDDLDPELLGDAILKDLLDPQELPNGWFHLVSAGTEMKGSMETLTEPEALRPESTLPEDTSPIVADEEMDAQAFEALSDVFRRTFRLAKDTDLLSCTTENVSGWTSLNQLKLIMEVENALQVRVPSDAVGSIMSFADLARTVEGALSSR